MAPPRRRSQPDGYIGTHEAAQRLGVSQETIRNRAADRRMRSTRQGGPGEGYIWVLEEDVEAEEKKRSQGDASLDYEETVRLYSARIMEAVTENRRIAAEIADSQRALAESITKITEEVTKQGEGQREYQEKVVKFLEQINPGQIRTVPHNGEEGEARMVAFSEKK